MLGYLTMNDDNALQDLASGFREALRHSVYLVRRLDADGELSAAQLSTLKMLLHEGQRVGEIARNLGVRVPSATEQIIKLERAGLARREPDPNDSRAVRVILTPEGRDAVDSANRRRNASYGRHPQHPQRPGPQSPGGGAAGHRQNQRFPPELNQ